MSAFAALMALSASQTKESQSVVQTAIGQRNRNKELRRKKQEEEERKRRIEESKLRQKRFEDEKKQRELEAKQAIEEARRTAEASRREEEARQALLYGPKKAKQNGPRWPTSSSSSSSSVERRRGEVEDEGPAMLTREEKRQRRVDAEMRRTYQLKRAASLAGYTKAGRRLPGGAIDSQSAPASDASASTQSVKARLTAQPNTLTRLNVNKRDTRTIDEIVQDMAKAKNPILDGDDAREFNDWFGKGKKKDARAASESSGAQSPMSTKSAPKSQSAPAGGKTVNPSGTKASTRPALSAKSSMTISRPSSAAPGKAARSKSPVPRSQTQSQQSARSVAKKRPRSSSLSDSPPPKRRAPECDNALGSEIWKLFGKNRSSYVARDVSSDDEDMEADMGDVLKEEMRSSRLAKREDEVAFEEEKRHEEDKRRRKREREMRERQGL